VFDLSEADDLADDDDVDAAGELLVDLQDLPDEAVLAIGGDRPGVLEFQAVLIDPLPCRLQVGDQFLCTYDEDDIGGDPGVGGQLASGRRGDDQDPVVRDGVDATQGIVGLV
jgi:hypothetical protein